MKKLILFVLLQCFSIITFAQHEWDIQLALDNLDCNAGTACYRLEVKNTSGADWTLGDQNYRLFFDGDLMTVTSVTSLLPSGIYGTANIDQNFKVSGQGQEAASPLDDIDDNIGFLDFGIVLSDKSNPPAAVQLSAATFTAVAEICVDVDAAVLNDGTGGTCLSFYHSRPSTAGSFTSQFTTISENDAPNSTAPAMGVIYNDLTSGADACLGTSCSAPPPPQASESQWDIQFVLNDLDCAAGTACYQMEVKNNFGTDWALGDQNYRLFFDGDLMTVTSVTSLLPNGTYGTANIDQNIKVTGQGQEAASPLDDIDDNLGFLDFEIVQTDKSNPAAAVQLNTSSYTAVAEICVDVDAAVLNDMTGTNCLVFYHSRPATAGSFTNQYTTISENDAPNSTEMTTGNIYDDLTSADGSDACVGSACPPPPSTEEEWDIQLVLDTVDCTEGSACYILEVKNTTGADWTLADQNYRLFFDGDLMTVTSVTSLLPNGTYGTANIDQNIKVTGQGQEAASPLDDIDDHLGFLDFEIVQTDKSNPPAAVQLNSTDYTQVARICVDVDAAVLTDETGDNCLAFYHSRPATAGNFTNQYTTISENDAPNSTTSTTGNNYNDVNANNGADACLGMACMSEEEWDIRLTLNDLDCTSEQACYLVEVKNTTGADWALADQNYRLFFDGDLMTVTSVTSLLPGSVYSTATIDQNIKVTGQGQEAASPLDNIDDHLGFLDFNIVQTDKSNPAAAVQLAENTYTATAEICVQLDPAVFTDGANNTCVSFYHSRPATAGSFTNQYTTLSENDAPNSTAMTMGNQYDDLTSDDGMGACYGALCMSSPMYDLQFSLDTLNCAAGTACYILQVKNNEGEAWALADQNYRIFFDGDLSTVTSVTSLLPATEYGPAVIDQNIKVFGQSQEAVSPLDDIDNNLGFLDFNIILSDKSNPSSAVQLDTSVFTDVAQICVALDSSVLADDSGVNCLAFYHSRPSTAGLFTSQYTTISENDAPGSTTDAAGAEYNDLTSADGSDACLGPACQDPPCVSFPYLVNAPFENSTVNCDEAIPFEAPIFADSCDLDLVMTFDSILISNDCGLTVTRTWTAENDLGNVTSFVQTVSTIDTVPPTMSASLSFYGQIADGDTIYADCSQVSALDSIVFSATDQCCSSVDPELDESATAGDCDVDGYLQIRHYDWKVTDCCGNMDSMSFHVVIDDHTAPVLHGVPNTMTVQCDDFPLAMPNVTATDGCDTLPMLTYGETYVGDTTSASYQIVRTWTATDACGNSTSESQVVIVFCQPVFDLALEKYLAPGQDEMVNISDEISYFIKVTNEGVIDAYNIAIVDIIPPGLVFSPNNSSAWSNPHPDTAHYVMSGPLMPGQSDSVEIKMIVVFGASGATLTNVAEIEGAEDVSGVFVMDEDSTPNNNNPAEDDIDEEEVQLLEHDPTGWIYCDKTGKIITGGTITVVGPNGIPNDEVAIVHDGSEGYYEFYAIGAPGVYTLSYNGFFPMSTDCAEEAGPFDPTGLPNPVVQGVDTLNSEYLADTSCAANPFYLTFDLELGDPAILLNNLPVQCVFISSIVCDDTNNNDTSDAGDQPIPNASVYLYDCADLNNPIDSTISDAQGHYSFDGLDPGNYTIGYDLPPGVRPVATGPINANGFSNCITLDWGECDTVTSICLYACPELDAGPDVTHCNSLETTQLNATVNYGTGTFSWFPTTGLNNPNIANPMASPNVSTSYLVTWVDGLGCVDTDVMNLSVGTSTPYVVNAPFTNMSGVCNGTVPYEAPVFTDDCDPDLTIVADSSTLNLACGYILTRTWTATNDEGNSTTFTQTVNVGDTEPPVLMTNNPFLNSINHNDTLFLECQQVPSVGSNDMTATDDCDSIPAVDFFEFATAANCLTEGFLQTMTCGYVATDDCGNTDSLFFTIILTDNTAPQLFGVPDDMQLSCGTNLPQAPLVSVVDNCTNGLTVNFSESTVPGLCGDVVTRTWSATDACGNTATESQIISFEDNEDPVFSSLPADLTIDCNDPVPAPVVITGTDNCDTDVDVDFIELVNSADPCTTIVNRIFTLTDNCGNQATHHQHIYRVDLSAPNILNVPANLSIDCSDDVPSVPINVIASDNCDATPTLSFTETQNGSGCNYQLIRTWTATDDCGNTNSASQTIQVNDDEAPVLTINHPILGTVQQGDTLYFNCDEVPVLEPWQASATDNCDDAPIIHTTETVLDSIDCVANGYFLLMQCGWEAIDECGNVSEFFVFFKVTDTEAPVILSGVPADVTVECSDLPAANAVIQATDNCDIDLDINMVETIGTGCPYTITRTWTVTDDCGNFTSASQIITVSDDVAPVLSGLPTANMSVECGNQVPSAANVTATDNCNASQTVDFSETQNGTGCTYAIIRTWTATDLCGNESSFTQTINVSDTEAPVLSGLPTANMSVECGSQIPSAANVTATDNCNASQTVDFSETQNGTGCTYAIIRTWTATDLCGNESSFTQTINVSDTEAPVLSGLPTANMSVECGSQVPSAANVTATDNCNASQTVDFSETQNGTGCTYAIIRTWTATDLCGNESSFTQTINVSDTEAPVLSGLPTANMSVECGNQVPSAANVTATDNCNASQTVDFSETQNGTGCTYAIIRTWTATDLCGNESSFTQTINVSDTEAPVLSGLPTANMSVECGNQVPSAANVTATDNCNASQTVDFSETQNGTGCTYAIIRTWTATDLCGNESSFTQTINVSDTEAPVLSGLAADVTVECTDIPPAANVTASDDCGNATVTMDETIGSFGCPYTIVRTWTATDDCGNTVSASQTITVEDTQAPVFISALPADVTVDCTNIPTAPNMPATDNCGVPDIDFDETIVSFGCPYTIQRTWTATDVCGNATVHTQLITVTDNVAPTVSEPADLTVSCGNVPVPVEPVFTDNCDLDLTIDYFEFVDNNSCGQEIKRVWTATDDCGNQATVDQLITVTDDVAPEIVFTHPWLAGLTDGDTLVMECDDPEIFGATDAEAVDDCSDAWVEFVENGITPGDCETDGFIVLMHCTWIATDSCGNSTSVTIHMRIEDNTPPVFTNVPADLTVDCGEPVPPCGTPNVSDGCTTDIDLVNTSEDVPTANGYDRICTWTATDACGNVSTAMSTIHVIDNGLPVISGVPSDTTIYLPNDETVPPAANVTATDGCTGDPLPVDFTEVLLSTGNNGCDSTFVRTWSVTVNGTTVSQEQIVTVIGGTNAVIVSTASEICEGGNGSAVLSPSTNIYAWSDGGSGHERNDLSAGTYSVTATNGNCSETLTVTIGSDCDCDPAVLDSIFTTDTGCGQMEGTATISLAGDEADYEYLWVPNLGTPNAIGNVRTGLPAQHYVVFVTYQGNPDCVEKFEFDIFDDCLRCPPVADAEAVSFNVNNSSAKVCIPVMYGIAINHDMEVNGQPFSGSMVPCDETDVRGYEYGIISGAGSSGMYSVEWQRGSDIFYTLVSSMDELAGAMNELDPGGKWKNDLEAHCLVTEDMDFGYGSLKLLHVPSGMSGEFGIDSLQVDMGTELQLGVGETSIVFTHPGSDCSDTLQVTLKSVEFEEAIAEIINGGSANEKNSNATVLYHDTLFTYVNTPVTADLLANDELDGEVTAMKIVGEPRNGIVVVSEEYKATYVPFAEFCNDDSEVPLDRFFYEVCMEDGKCFTSVAFVEVACRGEVSLFPNPADRYVNLNLAPISGRSVDVQVVSSLGVVVERIHVEEAGHAPLRIELDDYRAGHYAVWIFTEGRRAMVRQLIVARL